MQSAWFYGVDSLIDINATFDFGGSQQTPPLVGVELSGVNPQNVFSSNVGGGRGLLDPQAAPRKVSHSMMIGYGLAATLQPAALIKVRHRNVTGGYCGLADECATALLLLAVLAYLRRATKRGGGGEVHRLLLILPKSRMLSPLLPF